MFEPFENFTNDFQKMSKDGFDAAVRSYGEVSRDLQAIASRVTNYSKASFEDATRAFEQLVGVKSIEQAIEIQSQYAKKAFETYIAELSKLGGALRECRSHCFQAVERVVATKVA